jgi:hypothetical protein
MIKQIIVYFSLLIILIMGFFGYLYSKKPSINSTNQEVVEIVREQLKAVELQKGKYVSPRQQRAVFGE